MPAKPATINRSRPDVAVIGAGITGLWAAIKAAEAGLTVLVIEAAEPGAGASGGLVGALMPHQPSGWTPKKALQLDGLLTLPGEIAPLEAATGLSAGYRRTGRIMPISTMQEAARHREWSAGAESHWPGAFGWQAQVALPDASWLDPVAAAHGAALDTLAARLNPRGMVEVLAMALRQSHASAVDWLTGKGVSSISADCAIKLNDGTVISVGNVLIATGINAFELISPIVRRNTGTGVKGQAALLTPIQPVSAAELPVIYAAGLYVIAHDNGLIAVGSTSENAYSDAQSTDVQLERLIAQAQGVCPALRGATVVERWAGVRPKHESRGPVVTPLPDAPHVIALLGAYKIGFGIAHLMGAEAVGHVTGSKGPWRDVLLQGWT
jgi:glycine oxidase